MRRYRYAPSRLETLVNDGGIVNNLKRQPWKWLLVPSFLLGLFWCAWREIRRWHPDVIHAHWLLPQGLIVVLLDLLDRHTPPFLVTSHGADLFALRARPLTALKRFVVSRARALPRATERRHAARFYLGWGDSGQPLLTGAPSSAGATPGQ